MKNLKYILSLILLTMSIQGYCQQMYDRSGSLIGRYDSGKIYDRSGSYEGKVDSGRFYDRSGSYIGYISGNNVYNRSGSLIGRVSRVPNLVAAIVYFYGYYPLR